MQLVYQLFVTFCIFRIKLCIILFLQSCTEKNSKIFVRYKRPERAGCVAWAYAPPCYVPLIRADALNGKHPALRGRKSPLVCVLGLGCVSLRKTSFRVLESKCERFLIFLIKFSILHTNYKRLYIILYVISYSYKKV